MQRVIAVLMHQIVERHEAVNCGFSVEQ